MGFGAGRLSVPEAEDLRLPFSEIFDDLIDRVGVVDEGSWLGERPSAFDGCHPSWTVLFRLSSESTSAG